MILRMLLAQWLILKRDPLALVITFVVPLAFFSVFAAVFGSMDAGARQRVRTAVRLEDRSEHGGTLLESLRAADSLDLVEVPADTSTDELRRLVRGREVSVAIVVPEGFGDDLRDRYAPAPQIDLLADVSNPVAVEVVRGAVQAAAYPLLGPRIASGDPDGGAEEVGSDEDPMRLEVVDVLGGSGTKRPSVAFFAAGIGVMFLLFALSGRSAILIEERESGVLLRMLTSRLTLPQVLAGRWLYLLLLGVLQVTLMFAWGALVFGLDLFTWTRFSGFLVMTVTTAAAAAAFALLLGVACKSRAQLNGVAVALVLTMSALGGSMFPRFLMPEGLQAVGRYTFNAWALDGYRKVFWYDAGVGELAPELTVLALTTVVLFGVAGLLARRWRHA